MATVTRTTTWISGQILTASALNAEFNNLLNALALTNSDIAAGAAIAASKLAVTFPTGVIVGTTDAQTLTNKRITKRVTSITSSATPTVNTDITDVVDITAQGEAITSMTSGLSGTPTNKQTLVYEIKDDGTGRAITWGASFTAGGIALPTTTIASKILTVGFMYSTANALNKWRCIASTQET